MRKIITTVFLIGLTISMYGVSRYRVTSFQYKENKGNYWSSWSNPINTSILITMDEEKERITVYSNKTQVFDSLGGEPNEIDDDGNEVSVLKCLDQNGITSKVKFGLLGLRDDKYYIVMYLEYSNVQYKYLAYPLTD